MMNLKSGKVEGFEQFSQFTSLKEFNSHMEMWMLECTNGELGVKKITETT